MAKRSVRVGFLVLALTAVVAGPAQAGQESGGDVTFRLTLRGDVVADDAFSLAVNASNGAIISPGIRCGDGSEGYNLRLVPCQPGSFDFVVEGREGLPLGTELTYLWSRVPAGTDEFTTIYTETVEITEAHQVIKVVYDYGGSQLPNTAAAGLVDRAPVGSAVLLGLTIIALGVVKAAFQAQHIARGPHDIYAAYESAPGRVTQGPGVGTARTVSMSGH